MEREAAHPLATLSGAVVGIEAAHYLNRLLTTAPTKEPLVPALGGVPLGLKGQIERELEMMATMRIKPFFVFSGMEYPVQEKPVGELREAARINAEAWGLYNQHKAVEAVETFGSSGETRSTMSSGHQETND